MKLVDLRMTEESAFYSKSLGAFDNGGENAKLKNTFTHTWGQQKQDSKCGAYNDERKGFRRDA